MLQNPKAIELGLKLWSLDASWLNMTSDMLNFGTQEEFVMFLYFSLGPSEGQGASDTW